MRFSVFYIPGDRRAKRLANSLYEQLIAGGAEAELCDRLPPERGKIRSADAAIALGGDGFILAVAGLCTAKSIPVLGINCGHLGYLASEQELTDDTAERLIRKDYTVKKRMMIEILFEDGEKDEKICAINDLVLTRSVKMRENIGVTEIEARCDRHPLGSYRADGIVVSTPIGSTAYALSAGGSIIDPGMSCLCLTPICAHSLTARQIILSHDKTLTLINRDRKGRDLLCAVDGVIIRKLPFEQSVCVRASDKTADFISFKEGFFFDTLRKKMIDET